MHFVQFYLLVNLKLVVGPGKLTTKLESLTSKSSSTVLGCKFIKLELGKKNLRGISDIKEKFSLKFVELSYLLLKIQRYYFGIII
jgi:hypothetical protein